MAYSQNPDERKWYEGNWKCVDCGAAITRLPFPPEENRLGELRCRDCHMKRREAQGPRR